MRTKQDLEKVTIRLTRGTKDKLNKYYPEIGHNRAIRTILDNFIKRIEDRVNQRGIRATTIKEEDINDI